MSSAANQDNPAPVSGLATTADIPDDMLALLTDEERAAIDDGVPSAEEQAALQRLADGADDDEGDDDDDAAEGADAAAAAAAAEVAAAPAPAAAAPAASPAPAPAAAPAAAPAPAQAAEEAEDFDDTPPPQYIAVLPQDFDTRKTAAATKEAEAWTKFDAGEIDRGAFQKALGEVQAERAELDKIQTKFELSNEMNAQSAQQSWDTNVKSFLKEVAKADGVDYSKDKARAADLDMFIKILASNPATEGRSMRWFLQEAHKRTQVLHGVAAAPAPAPAAAAQTPEQLKAAAVARRKPDIAAAAKTTAIAQVPGADGPGDVGGDEFAALDALNGEALEAAIAKMTPVQRERYAQGT